jgi:hypothetical protein
MQQQLQTDIVQSFWLRFWREPHRGQHREWRGSIWHEQQAAHDKPTIVANPEEAFEFVRRVLHGQAEADHAGGSQGQRSPRASHDPLDRAGGGRRRRLRDGLRRLTEWWRGKKGAKP